MVVYGKVTVVRAQIDIYTGLLLRQRIVVKQA